MSCLFESTFDKVFCELRPFSWLMLVIAFLQIIDIMGDKIGKPLRVVVKRAHDKSVTLTVTPEEANPDM